MPIVNFVTKKLRRSAIIEKAGLLTFLDSGFPPRDQLVTGIKADRAGLLHFAFRFCQAKKRGAPRGARLCIER
jgi:hypothetical protein